MNRLLILDRIESLINNFKHDPNILCFLGLGSLANQERLDDYSDLDFFLIVKDGLKEHYLNDLSWLHVHPLVYQFKNTQDGHKAMYDDGIFLEFAIFDCHELKKASYAPGKVLYQSDEFDESILITSMPQKSQTDPIFRVNEILTNLYIGLLRDKRGEKASAFSFIQVYAMHHIYELLPSIYKESITDVDYYVSERRIEKRFVGSKALLARFIQGYDKNKESAKAILDFISSHYEINKDLKKRILELTKEKK